MELKNEVKSIQLIYCCLQSLSPFPQIDHTFSLAFKLHLNSVPVVSGTPYLKGCGKCNLQFSSSSFMDKKILFSILSGLQKLSLNLYNCPTVLLFSAACTSTGTKLCDRHPNITAFSKLKAIIQTALAFTDCIHSHFQNTLPKETYNIERRTMLATNIPANPNSLRT